MTRQEQDGTGVGYMFIRTHLHARDLVFTPAEPPTGRMGLRDGRLMTVHDREDA
ncbi:hypothetical protein [Streptomyces sp. NPDC005507]|uniref:hypothetical protein n=1 Tax=unclassified Streptomyces TaxID=2593676 RepID=UPI0033AACD6D